MTLTLNRKAIHWGDRTAVIDHTDETPISYAEFDRRISAATARLDQEGIGEGDPVAVLSRNRPAVVSLFFAARRLGAVLAPVSHRLAAGTVETLLGRIDPELVLVEPRFEELVPDSHTSQEIERIDDPQDGSTPDGTSPSDHETVRQRGDEILRERGDETAPKKRDDTTLQRASVPAPEDPVLYLHTGGTTGTPKVVVLTDRQIEWNCITEAAAWGLGNDDVSPIFLPLFHTGGWNLLCLPTLYVGGTVVLHREFDPGVALESIESHGGTHVFGVAAIFDAIASHPAFEDAEFSTVEWWMSGGGPTPTAVMDAYREQGERFTQGYGLTEGGPNNLYLSADRPDRIGKDHTVGRPFPDCSVRIVDADGRPVDDGEIGELELSGPVTAREYLHTEDGTFDGEWVSTGDLARIDDDGDVEVTGRVDNQFVSGGENVSPEEIESVLDGHPDVEAVGVIAIDHDRWGTVPKAIVVGDVVVERLESFAEEHLAGFKQPHEYEVVDDLPRSGPGKLDRNALRTEHGGAAE